MHIPSSGARYLGMLVLVFLNPGVNGQTTIDEVPAVAGPAGLTHWSQRPFFER